MKQRLFLLLTVLLFFACGPIKGESSEAEFGFKSTDQELMRELKTALKEATISFREDKDGFFRYDQDDAPAVAKIRDKLEKELHGGVTVKYDEPEATEYLRTILASKGMKYGVERRTDGEWTRWHPRNEEQKKEITMKVVERIFELKKQQLSTTCAPHASTPPNTASRNGRTSSC